MDSRIQNHFNAKEIEVILSGNIPKNNPIIHLFFKEFVDSSECINYTRNNVIEALNTIKSHDLHWYNRKKNELLDQNTQNANAVIGEMCCYSSLLNAFDSVLPIKTEKNQSTPDFIIRNENNEEIYIEVNSVQMNEKQYKALCEFESIKAKESSKIGEHVVTPYGNENADCVAENVIHKICQVKSNESQFSDKNPSVLWIDFQTEYINSIYERATNSSPIFSYNGFIYSNELWYSCYGIKNMPIFESFYTSESTFRKIPLMKHNGRFFENNNSKITAIMFCFPDSIVIYENPYSKCNLPKWFYSGIIKMKHFSYAGSKTRFPANKLIEIIEMDKNCVDAFYSLYIRKTPEF